MKSVSRISTIGVLLLSLSFSARGQEFVNLDFENATVPEPEWWWWTYPESVFVFIPANEAVPGWTVYPKISGGPSSVYYFQPHYGVDPYYLLIDAVSPYYAPGGQLEGNFSLAMRNGWASSGEYPGPDTPWLSFFVSQVGTIPMGTKSIHLQAEGAPFAVLVDGVEIPMLSLDGNAYGGDISSYAGNVVELKIISTAPVGWDSLSTPTIIDNITFSEIPVPEPTTSVLLGLGLSLLLAGRRNVRRFD